MNDPNMQFKTVKERLDICEQINTRVPSLKSGKVYIMGFNYNARNGIIRRYYVRKLNGRVNAWQGWVQAKYVTFERQ